MDRFRGDDLLGYPVVVVPTVTREVVDRDLGIEDQAPSLTSDPQPGPHFVVDLGS